MNNMRKLVLSSMIIMPSFMTHADINPYVTTFGGINFSTQTNSAGVGVEGGSTAGQQRDIDIKYKNSFRYGLATGIDLYHFDEKQKFRSEVEVAVNNLTPKSLTLNGVDRKLINTQGIKNISYMLNSYYDFKLSDDFTVFAGVGLGFAKLKYDMGYQVNPNVDIALRKSTYAFQHQFMIGSDYSITDNLSIVSRLGMSKLSSHDIDRYRVRAPENLGVGFDSVLDTKSRYNGLFDIGIKYSF